MVEGAYLGFRVIFKEDCMIVSCRIYLPQPQELHIARVATYNGLH